MKDKKTGNLGTKVPEDTLSRFRAVTDLFGLTIEQATAEAIEMWIENHRQEAMRLLAGDAKPERRTRPASGQ